LGAAGKEDRNALQGCGGVLSIQLALRPSLPMGAMLAAAAALIVIL
jgi:hypothetical protein